MSSGTERNYNIKGFVGLERKKKKKKKTILKVKVPNFLRTKTKRNC